MWFTADFPAIRFSQKVFFPIPFGATTPSPVMTTRRRRPKRSSNFRRTDLDTVALDPRKTQLLSPIVLSEIGPRPAAHHPQKRPYSREVGALTTSPADGAGTSATSHP